VLFNESFISLVTNHARRVETLIRDEPKLISESPIVDIPVPNVGNVPLHRDIVLSHIRSV
jgi:hypothetical protein